MSQRNPQLQGLASDALASLSSDSGDTGSIIELAKRVSKSRGIDIDLEENDPDMICMAFAETILKLDQSLDENISATYIEYSDFDEEAADREIQKSRELKATLTSFGVAEVNCSYQSGFWDKIPEQLHYIYADMLVSLCQQWQVEPLSIWSSKARG